MARQRYLRQIGTKKAPFIWTARKAARPDMVEYDPEIATTRIEALRKKRDELKSGIVEIDLTTQGINEAKEQTELEMEIKELQDKKAGVIPEKKKEEDPEQIYAEKRQATIDNDEDIIKIRAMGTEEDIKDYLETEFGIKSKIRDIERLRELALKNRIKIIFEKE